MSLERHSFSIYNLNMKTTGSLLIDATLHDKEIAEKNQISIQTHY